MTKLFTVFFVNACKYGELFVSLLCITKNGKGL